MNLGLAIKELRKQKKLNQTELAARAKLSQTALSQIEKGKRPGIQTLKNISAALGVSESLLYIMASDVEDVPESKEVLYEKTFPVIRSLMLQLVSDEEKS